MPFPTISESNAYNRPSSFSAVFVRPTGEKYQTLGGIMDASLQIIDYIKDDSLKRNKSNNASEFNAVFKMKQASLAELELIDTLCNGTSNFLFKMQDAGSIPVTTPAVTEGWVLVTSSQVDAKAKVDYSGDAADNAFIEVTIHGSFLNTTKDAVVKASIVDTTFEATGDAGTFHAIGTYTAAMDGGNPKNANMKPCGITQITLAYTGGAAQTLTKLTNVKLTAEFVGKPDSLRRQCVTAVNFEIEYDWTQTDATNLLLLDAMVDNDVDVVVTTLAAVVFTLTNQAGIQTTFDTPGDAADTRVIRFRHTGTILKSSFDSTVS